MEPKLLINQYIHQEGKLKKEVFLERIKNVRNLRVVSEQRFFIPYEYFEWDALEELHKAINTGVFKFGRRDKVFAFEIDKEIFDWFKNNELQTIQKQVIVWISAHYLSDCKIREYLDNDLYLPVLTEVKCVIQIHYSADFYNKYRQLEEAICATCIDGDEDLSSLIEEREDQLDELWKLRVEEYASASLSFVNCLPPKFLRNPFKHSNQLVYDDIRIRYSPSFELKIGYFTDEDWMTIVERDIQKVKLYHQNAISSGFITDDDIVKLMKSSEEDTLQRSESDKVMFEKWLYSYRNFEKTSRYIYQLFDKEPSVGVVYLVRQRNSDFYKIGWTERKLGLTEKQSVEARIASLQTGNPELIEIIGFFRASGLKTERTLHDIFDENRKSGEWFVLSENDCRNILNDNWRIENSIF